jgi:hypothetical protein
MDLNISYVSRIITDALEKKCTHAEQAYAFVIL